MNNLNSDYSRKNSHIIYFNNLNNPVKTKFKKIHNMKVFTHFNKIFKNFKLKNTDTFILKDNNYYYYECVLNLGNNFLEKGCSLSLNIGDYTCINIPNYALKK